MHGLRSPSIRTRSTRPLAAIDGQDAVRRNLVTLRVVEVVAEGLDPLLFDRFFFNSFWLNSEPRPCRASARLALAAGGRPGRLFRCAKSDGVAGVSTADSIAGGGKEQHVRDLHALRRRRRNRHSDPGDAAGGVRAETAKPAARPPAAKAKRAKAAARPRRD